MIVSDSKFATSFEKKRRTGDNNDDNINIIYYFLFGW